MKTMMATALTTLVLAFSSSVMASSDFVINANGNNILQKQAGAGNLQDTKIGVIADHLHYATPDIEITANGNEITQIQAGYNNEQTVSIGTVGCDC